VKVEKKTEPVTVVEPERSKIDLLSEEGKAEVKAEAKTEVKAETKAVVADADQVETKQDKQVEKNQRKKETAAA